ncbi:hypothetical protein TWF730_001401 [Orbilia blumenaviensis]|uniref:RNA polymerase II-associated factor 1 homolog n=1 Tax=Orbilia blumenaviensis TaxID=1796055 RepID=A0AAV9UIG4_9PEZI
MPRFEEFKRLFTRGLGDPIIRHKCKMPRSEGMCFVHDGGPVDLKDGDIIAQEVSQRLNFEPYTPATPEEVLACSTNDVKGIVYDGDDTYRYFVWLTVSRNYLMQPEAKAHSSRSSSGSGDALSSNQRKRKATTMEEGGDNASKDDVWTKIVKVPFLIWMGSPFSFLSFETVDTFFSGSEFEYSRYQLSIDGAPFLFNAPDDNSVFDHYNILGRDFIDSRFKAFSVDYNTLTLSLKRRNVLKHVPTQPSALKTERKDDLESALDYWCVDTSGQAKGEEGREEAWVKKRDEDLEKFLEEDEEDDDDDEDYVYDGKGGEDEEGRGEVGEDVDDGEEGCWTTKGFKQINTGAEASIDPMLLQLASEQRREEKARRDQEKVEAELAAEQLLADQEGGAGEASGPPVGSQE